MSIHRVMFVGHGPSNLPEDRVINVFHFSQSGAYEDNVPACFDAVSDFYIGARSTRPVAQWLSPWVQRDAELRQYDLAEAKPRVPTIQTLDLGAVPSAEGAPEEVALCITMHGAVPPALTARRRGRLYIGPLNNFGVVGGSTSAPSRPQATLITDLTEAAIQLAGLPATTFRWCIRSTVPAENFVPVASGYVDNAFDTQRRRGPEASTRTPWTTVGV